MNNAPQKPKRIDTRKNRKRPVSQGRKTLKQLGIEETPLTNPSRYLVYGTLSHKMLSYAQFRKTRGFTASDYQSFLYTKQLPSRVNHTLVYLTKIGYLTKSERTNPPTKQSKQKQLHLCCHAIRVARTAFCGTQKPWTRRSKNAQNITRQRHPRMGNQSQKPQPIRSHPTAPTCIN